MDNSINNSNEEIEISLYDIAAAVFRKKFMIAAIILLALALAAVYLFFADPVYESKASVMVQSLSSDSSASSLSSLISGFSGGTGTEIATEVALLTTRRTIQHALDSLDLSDYSSPEGLPYDQLDPPITAQSLIDGEVITVTAVTDTNIVEISVRNTDAQFAADLANAVADAFNSVLTGFARGGSSASIDFVNSQIPIVRAEFEDASRALADFQKENEVLQSTQATQLSLVRYNYLLSRRAPLTLEAQEADAILNAADFAIDYQSLSADENVQRIASEIAAAQEEMLSYDILSISASSVSSGSSALTGSQSDRYFTLYNRVQSLSRELEEYIISLLDSVPLQDAGLFSSAAAQKLVSESEIVLIDRLCAQESASLESVPELEMQLAALRANVEVYQTMLVSLMQMEQEARLRDAAITDNVTLVDEALVEEEPVSPNALLILAAAFVLGAFAGVGIALIMELNDQAVFTSDELKKVLPSDVPFLGWIPMLKAKKKDRYMQSIVYSNPNSFESEKYKLIASNIIFGRNTENRVITVCSTDKNEGKTSVMANVAVALTQNGFSVLLVDGDLRMPSCEQYFNLEHQERGLVDIVVNGEELDACIVQPLEDVPSLNLLPCGTKPAIPSLVYSSEKFASLVESLKQRYDIILFDAPPLSFASELLALTKYANEVFIVTRAGVTNKSVLIEMIDNFKTAGATIIGACLNAVILSHGASSGYGSSYSYSYSSKDPESMASVIKRIPWYSSRRMYYKKRYKRDEKLRGKKVDKIKIRPTHPYKKELDM